MLPQEHQFHLQTPACSMGMGSDWLTSLRRTQRLHACSGQIPLDSAWGQANRSGLPRACTDPQIFQMDWNISNKSNRNLVNWNQVNQNSSRLINSGVLCYQAVSWQNNGSMTHLCGPETTFIRPPNYPLWPFIRYTMLYINKCRACQIFLPPNLFWQEWLINLYKC